MSLNSLNRNILRISGLNSGLDTDSIITSMMTATRTKVNKQFRTQTQLEWKQQAYKDLNNELRKLKDEYSSVLKQDQNMLSEYNYRKYSVKMFNENDVAYASVLTDPNAKTGSYTIDYVQQLATAASVTTDGRLTGARGEGIKLSSSMLEVNQQLLAATGVGFDFAAKNGGLVIQFELDGKNFTVAAEATLESVISTINSSCENVKLSYSQLTDQFKLESRNTGAESNLYFNNNGFLRALGLKTTNDSYNMIGQNAILSINGVEIERSSNEFKIDGITYNLKKTFNEDMLDTGKNVTFTISRDIDSSVEMIKKYVDAYNGMIEKLNGILTEKVNRSYWPLTDDEKSEMTEKQIEQWESLAKTGMMRNDSQLQQLMLDLRMSFYTKVPGTSLTMSSIGLGGASSTEGWYAAAQMGKMELDEVKLRQALSTNPDQVFAMFTAKDDGGNVDNMGLVTRINTLIDNYTKNNEYVTQYYNDQAIERAKVRYNDMIKAMYKEEDRLWAKFSALEKTMSNLNSQSSWIGNQIG